ncbi:MAG TPA: TolC family protein [Terracidiphilus sp.]|nr:TolC family protein [Terracidiphilus sp.]
MPAGQSSVNTVNVSVQVLPPYATSVPAPDANGASLTLTIDEAIRRGLIYNLGAISAQVRRNSARASVLESASALLPTVSGSVSENVNRVSLAAEGFDASSLPSIGQYFPSAIGPFHYYAAQAQYSQSPFDMVAFRNLMAAKETGHAAEFDQRDAREQIVLAVAATYLQVLAQEARVTAAQSQVKYAQAIYDQAVQEKAAGATSSIEVNRSEVQLKSRQLQLLGQIGESKKQKMILARIIGLSVDREIQLAETLEPGAPALPSLDALYRQAMSRNDVKASEAELKSAEETRRAAAAERLPSVRLSGFFGEQGADFHSGADVYSGAINLNIPIFNGGQVRADEQQADAEAQQERAALAAKQEDVRFEVRSAWIDEDTASNQLDVAASNRTLAEETLRQSIDRFKVGAADSVEVAQSQDQLSAADHDYINSLYSLRLAQINLARAIGTAENDVPQILKGVRP